MSKSHKSFSDLPNLNGLSLQDNFEVIELSSDSSELSIGTPDPTPPPSPPRLRDRPERAARAAAERAALRKGRSGSARLKAHQQPPQLYTHSNNFGYTTRLIACQQAADDSGIIYAVAWNHFVSRIGLNIFAVAGESGVTVFKFEDENESTKSSSFSAIELRLKALISFKDPSDKFYAVCWSVNSKANDLLTQASCNNSEIPQLGSPLLIIAGENGIIRVISLETTKELVALESHGGAVNELKIHPKNHKLLLSASKDYSLRLWNLHTNTLVCIFGGAEGHLDQAATIDFNRRYSFIVSGALDWTIKIWSTEHRIYKEQDYQITNKLNESDNYVRAMARKQFKPVLVHFPYYTTNMVHLNVVDSIHFFMDGEFILSKGTENKLTLWKPGLLDSNLVTLGDNRGQLLSRSIMREWTLTDTSLWFIKMGISLDEKLVACGNSKGDIHLFNFETTNIAGVRTMNIRKTPAIGTIRHMAFNTEGNILVAVSDDAKVFAYELIPKKGDHSGSDSNGHLKNNTTVNGKGIRNDKRKL